MDRQATHKQPTSFAQKIHKQPQKQPQKQPTKNLQNIQIATNDQQITNKKTKIKKANSKAIFLP